MASVISAGTTSGTSLNLSADTSGVLQLATNGTTTALTIDTGQNVGIGTTTTTDAGVTITTSVTRDSSWDAKLALQSTGATDFPALFFSGCSGTSRYGGIIQTASTSGNTPTQVAAILQFVNTSSTTCDIAFNTNGNIGTTTATERMRINSNGNIVLQGGTIAATGTGITFPATQSASSDANCLDDYEEGTWTPTILTGYTGTITYSSQVGRYTKIGDVVTFSFRISVSSGTRNTNILSFSLPFVGKNIGFQTGFASWAYANSSVIGSNTTNLPTLYPETNAAIMYCYKTTPDAFAGTDLAGSVPDIYIGGTYLTAT